MRFAILCPGPSIALFDGAENYDHVIGVNRAATKVACSVWAAGDPPLIESVRSEVVGTPTLFTSANAAAILRDHGPQWIGKVEEFESFYDGQEDRFRWNMFTATAALWYASAKGATRIRVFGADWKGTADFDGKQAGMNRSQERWDLEKVIWQHICLRHVRNGTFVDRITQ